MKIINRHYLKLAADPWREVNIQTADSMRVALMVTAAVNNSAMVSIIGRRGSGKTVAVRAALGDDVQLVEPLRLTRNKLHMGDIESALVRDLSDESPRRSGEARSHQVRRILGTAAQRGPVVLVIDDAHVLHHQTLRALKRLRELKWLGRSPLLGIVLIGQQDKTAAIPEVGLRSDQLWLAGLAVEEAATAIAEALGKRAEANAVKLMAKHPDARNWLDLIALVDDCIANTVAEGADTIKSGHVRDVMKSSSGSKKSSPKIDHGAVEQALQPKTSVAAA